MTHPHFLDIPDGKQVQNALHEAEKELAHSLGHQMKAQMSLHKAIAATDYNRQTKGFCLHF